MKPSPFEDPSAGATDANGLRRLMIQGAEPWQL